MPNSRVHECRKTPCHFTPNKGCEVNNLIRKFELKHECPCYSCLVKTMCKSLCKEYTRYVDPILKRQFDDLYFFKQEDKYEQNGRVSGDFLQLLVDRTSHYRSHTECYVELDEIEYEDHSEYSTARLIFPKE